MKKIFTFLVAVLSVAVILVPQVSAKSAKDVQPANKGRILFVPHDNRPISDEQTAEVVEKLGYDVMVPPDKILGGRDDLGHADLLWKWVDDNIANVDAAVISSDSMLYGSLVGSRKHQVAEEKVLSRAAKFEALRRAHPKLRLYVFSSIMRTPRSAEASGSEEPDYYQKYGSDIFRYTALSDKKETDKLTKREQKEFAFMQQLIPKDAIDDWMSRRSKNFKANKTLIDQVRKGTFNYFILGRDDNAPYSQTHKESRELLTYGKGLPQTKFQSMAGIDEIGLLLLARAVNDVERKMPFVFVRYNWGRGPNTVPSYSDERLGDSIRAAVVAAGGMLVDAPEKAEFVLAVNTNPNGVTGEANNRDNDGTPRDGTGYFADIVSEYVAAGYPVGIADVAFANGADNALMEQLKQRNLLFKLRAYAGWNTATNSTGFVLGEGILANRMTDDARDQLLLRRYLDDWAYQSNVRTIIGRQLGWLRGSGAYASLDDKTVGIEARADRMINDFALENLPPMNELTNIKVTFPWNRMFEARITTGK